MALFHFLYLNNIPLLIPFHVVYNHILFIHSSIDGQLYYFHVLNTVNSGVKNSVPKMNF